MIINTIKVGNTYRPISREGVILYPVHTTHDPIYRTLGVKKTIKAEYINK